MKNTTQGCFLRDTSPAKPRKKESAILNLDDSSGGGTHWVWYFDSFGLPPPTELDTYLCSEVFYPTEQIQPKQEVFCGHLCLFFSESNAKRKNISKKQSTVFGKFIICRYNIRCLSINLEELQKRVKM